MNVVGKILVILNLLIALVTGAFLTIDFATRTNWKNYAKALEDELRVARANFDTGGDTRKELDSQLKKALASLETEKQGRKDDVYASRKALEDAKNETDVMKQEIDKSNLLLEQYRGEVERHRVEIKNLNDLLAKREQTILKKEEEIAKANSEAVAKNQIAKQLQARLEKLLEDLVALRRQMAEEKEGKLTRGGPIDFTKPNPPTVFVKGKVKRVDKSLILVSLGSDEGIQKFNTLEVYRLTPERKYLGMVRIMQVDHHESVGRMMTAPPTPLQVGDVVASSLELRP